MARVIQADAAARVVPAVVVDATDRAQRLIAAAHAEADAIRAAARDEGRMQGRAELTVALLDQQRAHAQAVDALEQQTLDVALLVAKRVVGEALALEPQRIAEIALPLLSRLRRARRLVLRVHPEDCAALAALLQARVERGGAQVALQVEGDITISRGGCIASSDIGTLDARVETQLEAIARALQPKTP